MPHAACNTATSCPGDVDTSGRGRAKTSKAVVCILGGLQRSFCGAKCKICTAVQSVRKRPEHQSESQKKQARQISAQIQDIREEREKLQAYPPGFRQHSQSFGTPLDPPLTGIEQRPSLQNQ